MRSKGYRLERRVGLAKCKSKRCQVCLIISKTDTFKSFQTKQKYKKNRHLNCNDKCLGWNSLKENDRKALIREEHIQQELIE